MGNPSSSEGGGESKKRKELSQKRVNTIKKASTSRDIEGLIRMA